MVGRGGTGVARPDVAQVFSDLGPTAATRRDDPGAAGRQPAGVRLRHQRRVGQRQHPSSAAARSHVLGRGPARELRAGPSRSWVPPVCRAGSLDADTTGPVDVHVYVDGSWARRRPGRHRPARHRRGVPGDGERATASPSTSACPAAPTRCASTPSTSAAGRPTRCSAVGRSPTRRLPGGQLRRGRAALRHPRGQRLGDRSRTPRAPIDGRRSGSTASTCHGDGRHRPPGRRLRRSRPTAPATDSTRSSQHPGAAHRLRGRDQRRGRHARTRPSVAARSDRRRMGSASATVH